MPKYYFILIYLLSATSFMGLRAIAHETGLIRLKVESVDVQMIQPPGEDFQPTVVKRGAK